MQLSDYACVFRAVAPVHRYWICRWWWGEDRRTRMGALLGGAATVGTSVDCLLICMLYYREMENRSLFDRFLITFCPAVDNDEMLQNLKLDFHVISAL